SQESRSLNCIGGGKRSRCSQLTKPSVGWRASHRAATKVNPRVASTEFAPKAEPSMVGRRQHGMAQTDRRAMSLRRGSRGSTVTRTCQATGETVLVPLGNQWSKVHRI